MNCCGQCKYMWTCVDQTKQLWHECRRNPPVVKGKSARMGEDMRECYTTWGVWPRVLLGDGCGAFDNQPGAEQSIFAGAAALAQFGQAAQGLWDEAVAVAKDAEKKAAEQKAAEMPKGRSTTERDEK